MTQNWPAQVTRLKAIAMARIEKAKWQYLQGEYTAPEIEPTTLNLIAVDFYTGKFMQHKATHVSPYGAWAMCANHFTATAGHTCWKVMLEVGL